MGGILFVKIITVQFNFPVENNRADYEVLLNVFRESCRRTMPNAKFVEVMIPAPTIPEGGNISFLSNTVKLREWRKQIDQATENVILADCDMLALKSAEEVFDLDFDIAYTERTKTGHLPLNGGIIFVKPTEMAREFFAAFEYWNQAMYEDAKFHEKWREKYRGMNQAAFGYLLETNVHGAKVIGVPCQKYNAVNNDWHNIDGETCFVHFKSELRKMILARQRPNGRYEKAMIEWYKIASELEAKL